MNQAESHALFSLVLATPALLVPLLFLWGEKPTLPPPPDDTNEESARETESDTDFSARLQAQLLALSVCGYERLIAQVLRAVGYENVRVLRDYRKPRLSHKGRNRHGGADITALVSTEFSTQPVLVQVKQYRRPISRRFVDELRGALLRTQARQGLLITTSTFAPRARQAASEDHIGPIHLIDGAELGNLLVRYRLGVGENGRGKLYVRKRFFRRLERFVPDQSQLAWEQV